MPRQPVNCPRCGHRLEVDGAVDTEVACPACQAVLRVEAAATGRGPGVSRREARRRAQRRAGVLWLLGGLGALGIAAGLIVLLAPRGRRPEPEDRPPAAVVPVPPPAPASKPPPEAREPERERPPEKAAALEDRAPPDTPEAEPEPAPAAVPEWRSPAEVRYEQALEPVERMIGYWKFQEAFDALARLRFEEPALEALLAVRRGEAERLAALKERLIHKVNTARPMIQKSRLLIGGLDGPLMKAEHSGIAALPHGGEPEILPWHSLSSRSVERLLSYVVDGTQIDDCLAAGILALVCGDARTADACFEKARQLGAAADRHKSPMAAAAFDGAMALLAGKRFAEADAALAEIERKYAATPWLAAYRAEFDAARRAAKAGAAGH